MTVGARLVAAALTEPCAARSRDQWLALAGDCQSLINTLTAVQDAAIAEAARRESVWCEDGTLGETVHAPGRVTLDAADVVAPVIGASHAQAQRRVEQAVRLAAGRVPVPADDRDVPQASGLGRLHEAMTAGQLDGYRAGVIAFELEVAPPDVADAIVTALGDHLGDEAATLRQRTRVLLSRISPDLVRERAKRARAATGLRRWVAEPGVDEWHGTFPSEDAATAWAAIDHLAHDLVAAGTCTNIEQARGKALTDLITGNATIDVQVILTVPADTDDRPHPAHPDGWPHPVDPDRRPHPAVSGSTADSTSLAPWSKKPVRVDDPWPISTPLAAGQRTAGGDSPRTQTTAEADHRYPTADDSRTTGHDDDLVQVHGARPSEPLLVRRGWLRDHLPKTPPQAPRAGKRPSPRFVPCDPLTGARLDPGNHLTTDTYRPNHQLAALVRARDGRCRFPGCSIAARFCDLDHARPWPTGPTCARNLLTLCRRHHRIKQRPGWQLHLTPDATTTWTDPTGRTRTTTPLNALHSLVLRADAVADLPAPPPTADAAPDLSSATATPEVAASMAWSALETHLGLRLEHHPHQGLDQHLWLPPTHRRCTTATELRAGFTRRRARDPAADPPPF